MIIICGKTIAEVERDLEMAKQAIASGMPYGIGGENIEDVEQAMGMLSGVVDNTPISNPNYASPCENCGCPHPSCGCCENEEDDLCENGLDIHGLDGLTAEEIDRITASYGLPKAWAEIAKQILGL